MLGRNHEQNETVIKNSRIVGKGLNSDKLVLDALKAVDLRKLKNEIEESYYCPSM